MNIAQTMVLKAEVFSLTCRGDGIARVVGSELMIAFSEEIQLETRLPRIESEKAFIVRLVRMSSGEEWSISALQTVPEQPFSFMVNARHEMQPDELRRKEVERLTLLQALRLLNKLSHPSVAITASAAKGKRTLRPSDDTSGSDESTGDIEARGIPVEI